MLWGQQANASPDSAATAISYPLSDNVRARASGGTDGYELSQLALVGGPSCPAFDKRYHDRAVLEISSETDTCTVGRSALVPEHGLLSCRRHSIFTGVFGGTERITESNGQASMSPPGYEQTLGAPRCAVTLIGF